MKPKPDALRAGPDWDPAIVASRMADIVTASPGLPQMTVLVMANDAISADYATGLVMEGMPWRRALTLVGSYSRIGWLLDLMDAGLADRRDVLRLLPQEWTGADPDDTDPRMLAAWREAWDLHAAARPLGSAWPGPILDRIENPLPDGRSHVIYRGQGRHDAPGIAWSLDRDTAERFARGAGLRVPGAVRDPVVLSARVHRRQVIAYLTGRGEAEVIVNPHTLGRITVEGEA